MNKREKQKEETLADILRVSEELFVKQGYENTSIQQIADGCGMTKGALYHHFKSKEDVLERLCGNHYRIISEASAPIVKDTSIPWIDRIEKAIAVIRGIGLEKAPFVTEYMKLRRDEGAVLLKDRLNKYDRRLYIETLAPILEEARDSGSCTFPSGPEVMAVFIYQLDRAVTDEIAIILSSSEIKDSEEKIRSVLEGFIHTLCGMLGVERDLITKIVKTEEALHFFRQILQNMEGQK